VSSIINFSLYCGQGAKKILFLFHILSHNSSAKCGANGLSNTKKVSFHSFCMVSSFGNQLFTKIIKLAIAVLNLYSSISSLTFFIVL